MLTTVKLKVVKYSYTLFLQGPWGFHFGQTVPTRSQGQAGLPTTILQFGVILVQLTSQKTRTIEGSVSLLPFVLLAQDVSEKMGNT